MSRVKAVRVPCIECDSYFVSVNGETLCAPCVDSEEVTFSEDLETVNDIFNVWYNVKQQSKRRVN